MDSYLGGDKMESTSVPELMKQLHEAELKPYIHCKAASGSIYIKFKENIGGSLRVGTHRQRRRYAYKWNLRTDVTEMYTKMKTHKCYYYPALKADLMIKEMVKERDSRNSW